MDTSEWVLADDVPSDQRCGRDRDDVLAGLRDLLGRTLDPTDQARHDLAMAVWDGQTDAIRTLHSAGVGDLDWSSSVESARSRLWVEFLMEVLAEKFSNEVWDVVRPMLGPGLARDLSSARSRGVPLIRRLMAVVESNPDPRPARTWLSGLIAEFDDPAFVLGAAVGARNILAVAANERQWSFSAGVAMDPLREKADLIRHGWAIVERLERMTHSDVHKESVVPGFVFRLGILALNSGDMEGCDGLLKGSRFGVFLARLGSKTDAFGHLRARGVVTLEDWLARHPKCAQSFLEWATTLGTTMPIPTRLTQDWSRLPLALSPSKSVKVKGLMLNMILNSPARTVMLAQPSTRERLMAQWMADDGLEARVASMTSLAIPEILGLIRDHAIQLAPWRDKEGNNLFHYLVAIRSESQSVLALASGIDERLLAAPNNSGRSVLDLLHPSRRVLAERLLLKKTSKTPVHLKKQTNRKL